ncbi:MAG TPA: NfeD family protein [Gammaproteobacteria bacterium]|jgi:membrane protein implicated in regulation of membrane protease activity|nr:NfeD family protein [Gammaproteobacteria bacterium]
MNASELYALLGPWTWIAVGVVLAILEILLPGTFLIWFALAALVVGILDLVFTLTLSIELIAFAVISIPTVALGYWLRKGRGQSARPILHERAEAYIGKTFVVIEAIENGKGRISVGDTLWIAEGDDCAEGGTVKVVGSQGNVLLTTTALESPVDQA